jgi:hypothetical protein
MSDFSVNDFLTSRSGNFRLQQFKYERLWKIARITVNLLISCQIPPLGHSAMKWQLRYTARLVPIKDFEGKP